MEDMADLSDMKNEFLERVQTAIDKACEYRNRSVQVESNNL